MTFHQDWSDEYASLEAAVSGFASREGKNAVLEVLSDSKRIRETQISDSDLDQLLVAVGCEHDYSLAGETAKGWLATLERWLRANTAG